MINVKVNQTIRVNIAVWDVCGELGTNAIFISDVGIDTMPALDPVVRCQDVTGLAIEFRLVTPGGDIMCQRCTPDVVYSTWGTVYTDSRGYAYIDHTITPDDLAAYRAAAASGNYVKVLACITGAKGQRILTNKCSEPLTVLTPADPTHYIDFKMFENTSGILEAIKNYTSMLTAGFNMLTPPEAGWSVHSTEVYPSDGILRLYLSETGSWGIIEWAEFLLTLVATVIGGILLLFVFWPVGLVAIGIIVAAVIAVNYIVVNLINLNVELAQTVDNLKTKTQLDTSEDQVASAIFAEYEKSAKTKDDCLNLLNGLRINTSGYLDKMQKSFPELYTPAIKRQYQSTVDNTIKDFKDGKITCDQASMAVLTARSTTKADTSTNFNGNYNTGDGYVPPKHDCWISKPLSEDCILSAETGMWIAGTIVAVIGLGITYWAVTRKPAETRLVFEKAKETVAKGGEIAKAEYERMKTAYGEIRAPAVPRRVPVTALMPPRVPEY